MVLAEDLESILRSTISLYWLLHDKLDFSVLTQYSVLFFPAEASPSISILLITTLFFSASLDIFGPVWWFAPMNHLKMSSRKQSLRQTQYDEQLTVIKLLFHTDVRRTNKNNHYHVHVDVTFRNRE